MNGNDFPRRTKRCRAAYRRLWEKYGERLGITETELYQMTWLHGTLLAAMQEAGYLNHKGLRQAAEKLDEECGK